MIYENILDLVGHTPVIKYKTINQNTVYLKLEMFNPAGSVKDRVALQIILDLKKKTNFDENTPLVEATSGNTGIGFSFVLASMGMPPYIFMPESMSSERIQLMEAYGARVTLTPASEGMKGATERAKVFAKEQKGIYLNQFMNKSTVSVHKKTTAKEIKKDFKDLDYIVSGIGTAGTITGLGLALKKHYKNLNLIGVEPKESPVLTENRAGPHGIQGIGAGFFPPLCQKELIDEIITVSTIDAKNKAKVLAKTGLLLGISSAAAIHAAEELCCRITNKTILVICPDGGSKYISLGVY